MEEKRDFTKIHYSLSHDNKRIWCIHCGKILEERYSLPDYIYFMGGVFLKKNLPCTEGSDKPYTDNPKGKD